MNAGAEVEFKPELFDHGCNHPLPVSRYVDEYEIGEVIPLEVVVGDVTMPVLLDARGKNNVLDTLVELGAYRDWTGAIHSYASAIGGVSADDLIAEQVDRSLEPVAETLEVAAPLDLLATSRVTVGDDTLRFTLTPNASRSLLRGEPAALVASNARGVERRLEIVSSVAGNGKEDAKGKADGDGTLKAAIGDLGEFLARRTLYLNGREPRKIKLNARQVRSLIANGRVNAQIGETKIALQTVEPSVEALMTATRYESVSAGVALPQVTSYPLTSTPAPGSSLPPPPPPPGSGIDPTRVGQQLMPTFNSLPLALYVPVGHTWELLGYGRGGLIHTVGLAPQEELTLEIHSWQKFTESTETTEGFEFTGSSETTDTTRDSNEVLTELTKTNDLRNNLGGNLSYSGYGFNVNLNGGAGDVAVVTDTFRDTTTNLHELVVKTTNQLKTSRQVKVTEGSDIGSEQRVTRRLRNPNMCHALAIDTYEVMAYYKVRTVIARAGARLCVLIDNPLGFGFFTRQEVRHYETVLSQSLFDRGLRGGFAAARMLAERHMACGAACERCTCGDAREMLLSSGVSEAITRIFAAIDKLRDKDPGETLAWVDGIIGPSGANNNANVFDPNNYAADRDRLHRFIYGALLKAGHRDLYRLLLETPMFNVSRNDPVAATRAILAALGGADPDDLRPDKLLAKYRLPMEEDLYRFYRTRSSDPSAGKVAVIQQTGRYWGITARDEGLADALKALVSAVQPATDDEQGQQQADPVAVAYPVGVVAEALEREEALLAHLNENRDHYRYLVFMSLPAQTQLDLLRSRGYDFPGLDLRPVGRDGPRLAFALARLTGDLRRYFEKIAAANDALDPVCGEDEVELPTAGIHLQTRLSECDACESYIDGIRKAEVQKRQAEADQATHEAERYKKRLDGADADDSLLDDPSPTVMPPLHVILDRDGSGEQPPPP